MFYNIGPRRQHGLWTFCNFYKVKYHEIARNSTTTEAREKNSTEFESSEFKKKIDACLAKFKNIQILLNNINQ
jgi:hypothetical protein